MGLTHYTHNTYADSPFPIPKHPLTPILEGRDTSSFGSEIRNHHANPTPAILYILLTIHV
jgi:hypothetical protein